MKLLSRAFSELEELQDLLAQASLRQAVAAAKSVLVQIYNRDEDADWIGQVVSVLRGLRPDIVVVGALSFGHIADGKVADARTMVSLSCFDTAGLKLIEHECTPGGETAAARHLVNVLCEQSEPVRGVLLLSTPLVIDCNLLLSEINALSPGLPVFGGGSANLSLAKMMVFSQHRTIRSGLVAVALCGGTLEIMRSVHLGWLPIGRKMRITSARGAIVETIDDRPAIEVYERYLGIVADERFFLNVMEFPLLVDRHGELHARVPYEAYDDGSIRFTAELAEGEEVHFGYARVEAMKQGVQALEADVQAFGPEAIHIYTCIIRHFVLQRDIDLELSPLDRLAPTAGFVTAGEFCSRNGASTLRNAAMVVVAMRESPVPVASAWRPRIAPEQESANLYEDNHMRILLRYQHFMQAITEDLQAANEELARLAERDVLTGLFNRRKLDSVMQNEIERGKRYHSSFSVIVCDVDHFKQFNDLHGHQAGDAVLKALSHVILGETRATDVVCRFGGEEFVIVMPQTGTADALEFAERIRVTVGAVMLHHLDRALPPISMSFGVAGYPHNGSTADELISAADAALYDAKRQGRNRVCVSLREAGQH